MTFTKPALKLAAAALGLALVAGAAPANAQSSGMALAANERCAVQVYLSNSSAQVVAKAAPGLSGSYRLLAYQGMPTGATEAGLSGSFSGSGSRDSILTRTHLGLGFVGTRRVGSMSEIRDAEYGQNAALHVDLAVFDQRGRLICRSQTPAFYPVEMLDGPAVSPTSYQAPNAAPYRGPAAATMPDRTTPRASQLERSRGLRAIIAARRQH
ncbi:hypothetical protein [uncultured Maricaulis sp.]|uniref:hypothetical protein n=1 Tax=uncultured Maricaulis sp. TaxID=174710 RepID=UPI0030DB0851|tara:strand:+ start:80582 stop:81214 length:633 start_codon:yes stop_codon:yes gene_type:complete